MPKFRVFIHGVNFHLRDIKSPSTQQTGFYVTAYVEAVSPQAAESASIDLLRATPKLRETVLNPPDDPPQMFVEEIEELADWPADSARPLSGFAFYNDTDENNELEYMNPDWPPLSQFAATAGRLATAEDTRANRASFLLESDGLRVGTPVLMDLPAFAWLLDRESNKRERCVIFQAEEADGKIYFGGWLLDREQQIVGFSSDFELIPAEDAAQ
jgi:hypothetical protein